MSEAPKRIWADGDYTWVEYIRADLVEAAIKRALEAATKMAQRRCEFRREDADRLYEMNYQGAENDAKTYEAKADEAERIAREIRALYPEQFIEEKK